MQQILTLNSHSPLVALMIGFSPLQGGNGARGRGGMTEQLLHPLPVLAKFASKFVCDLRWQHQQQQQLLQLSLYPSLSLYLSLSLSFSLFAACLICCEIALLFQRVHLRFARLVARACCLLPAVDKRLCICVCVRCVCGVCVCDTFLTTHTHLWVL